MRRTRVTGINCAFVALVLANLGVLRAQSYRFQLFGIEEGLGNLAVTALAQDAKGQVWIGTLNGIYRYDGNRVKAYGRKEGLVECQIVALAATPEGDLWAATSRDVELLRGDRFVPVAFDRDVRLRGPSSLAIDPESRMVWAATSVGVFTMETPFGSAIPQAHWRPELRGVPLQSTVFALDGSRWFGGDHQIYQLTERGPIAKAKTEGVPDDAWGALLVDAKGTLWARSATRVIALDRGKDRFTDRTADLPSAEFAALGMGSHGELLAPTVRGLAFYSAGKWSIVSSRNGLPMESVSSVLFDREGSPWIGMNGGGVGRWLGFGQWENWTSPEWLRNDAAWSFAESPDGEIWAGTNNGIVQFSSVSQGSTAAPPVERFHLPSGVRTLALGHDGVIWAGTSQNGLFRCTSSGHSCQAVSIKPNASNLQINRIFIDKTGTYWVAADSGLFRSTRAGPSGWIETSPPGVGRGTSFRSIIQDAAGDLWISGMSGISRIRKGRWERLSVAEGLLENDVAQVASDRPGSLWLSYEQDRGISHLVWNGSGQRVWKHFDETAGLGSNYIYGLIAELSGRVWISTDRGIDFGDGKRWRHFGTSEGLVWPDLNTAAIFEDSTGGVWFGTSRGIAHLLPSKRDISPTAPVPLISQALVNGREQDLARPISIPYRDAEVTLRFTTVSFAEAGATRFRYRIEGLQSKWQISPGREVQLAHPPSGEYLFAVEAIGPGGVVSRSRATLQLLVATPWWRTKLFLFVFGAALLGCVRLLWIARIRAMLRRQRELEKAISERTAALTHEQQRLLRAQEESAFQATHDALTGLANRSLLNSFLDRMVRDNRPASVLWIDLDRFKSVNDLHGHLAGDSLLREASNRLRAEMRAGDLVARIGGDEFVAVVGGDCQSSARGIAERLLARMGEPFLVANHSLSVSASIGLVQFPQHAATAEELLRNADMAMYRAKRGGKSSVYVFTPESANDMAVSVEIERQMEGAVERGEMSLVYQPQVACDGTPEGVEALLRWSNPILGAVSPAHFIPAAEENGSIVPIGEWVLRTACRQGAQWLRAGHELRVAVNVSVLQLGRPDFAQTVERILLETQFEPRLLELEVTESAVMRNTGECIRQMESLRAAGVLIAIDDFGTGNSSLSYLRMLPVDVLKIDRSFVTPLDRESGNSCSMIRAIIGLAHGLGLRLVAEGVEREDQAAILREETCDLLQGYLFSRPLPADAILEMLPVTEMRLPLAS